MPINFQTTKINPDRPIDETSLGYPTFQEVHTILASRPHKNLMSCQDKAAERLQRNRGLDIAVWTLKCPGISECPSGQAI
ncbi:hypothetical protein A1O3_08019 [Capronia epimyces CBS 606.96]|uniref:Uncharacterized protein n=1 Tax=Capronia epimyces CBS 606.96 TaxID=1182542 RepID=W9XRW7_9EURO|nr:uncharacterized protein A1O3_08019 [Capronia epimyces CBS 606.96]EXJ79736.1 hypothetical protein A1O3_08019 [Capronia epimyces CBS 606.96]